MGLEVLEEVISFFWALFEQLGKATKKLFFFLLQYFQGAL